MRVRAHKSVAGISSKTMQMFVLYMSVRLCSTTLKRGYSAGRVLFYVFSATQRGHSREFDRGSSISRAQAGENALVQRIEYK